MSRKPAWSKGWKRSASQKRWQLQRDNATRMPRKTRRILFRGSERTLISILICQQEHLRREDRRKFCLRELAASARLQALLLPAEHLTAGLKAPSSACSISAGSPILFARAPEDRATQTPNSRGKKKNIQVPVLCPPMTCLVTFATARLTTSKYTGRHYSAPPKIKAVKFKIPGSTQSDCMCLISGRFKGCPQATKQEFQYHCMV